MSDTAQSRMTVYFPAHEKTPQNVANMMAWACELKGYTNRDLAAAVYNTPTPQGYVVTVTVEKVAE